MSSSSNRASRAEPPAGEVHVYCSAARCLEDWLFVRVFGHLPSLHSIASGDPNLPESRAFNLLAWPATNLVVLAFRGRLHPAQCPSVIAPYEFFNGFWLAYP
jgi:hypothetical protein